jgi:hypothetical protein
MSLQNRYSWEAELADGSLIKSGEDLSDAVRVTLVPAPGSRLPGHSLVGVPMVRRFGRGFIQALGGGIREYLHCIITTQFRLYVRSTDGAALITPADYELYL